MEIDEDPFNETFAPYKAIGGLHLHRLVKYFSDDTKPISNTFSLPQDVFLDFVYYWFNPNDENFLKSKWKQYPSVAPFYEMLKTEFYESLNMIPLIIGISSIYSGNSGSSGTSVNSNPQFQQFVQKYTQISSHSNPVFQFQQVRN